MLTRKAAEMSFAGVHDGRGVVDCFRVEAGGVRVCLRTHDKGVAVDVVDAVPPASILVNFHRLEDAAGMFRNVLFKGVYHDLKVILNSGLLGGFGITLPLQHIVLGLIPIGQVRVEDALRGARFQS